MQKFPGFSRRSRALALIKTAVTVPESGLEILSEVAEAWEYCVYTK